MSKSITVLAASAAMCAGLLLVAPRATALEPVAWQSDFAVARQMAQQSNRLVLMHFWSPDCGPCRALESKVFNQPGFAQGLSVHYVPVKVNVYEQPGLMQAYKVTQFPTELVVGLDGKEISRFVAPQNPATYLATATQIARANPPAIKPFGAGPATAPSVAAMPQTPPAQLAGSAAMTGRIPGRPVEPTAATAQFQAAAPAQGSNVQAANLESPPLALDGYCPVRLCENHNWVKGNPQYGVNHRGRLYLFAGPTEQQSFWKNPDRYSVAAGGEDPVAAIDQGLRVAGKREFGMFYGHRIFLFSSEEAYQRFEKNPSRYAAPILQAERPVARY